MFLLNYVLLIRSYCEKISKESNVNNSDWEGALFKIFLCNIMIGRLKLFPPQRAEQRRLNTI